MRRFFIVNGGVSLIIAQPLIFPLKPLSLEHVCNQSITVPCSTRVIPNARCRLFQQRYFINRLNHLGGFRTSELGANGSWMQKGLSHLTSTTPTNSIIKTVHSLPGNSSPKKQRKDRGMADNSREQPSLYLKGRNDPFAQSEQPCHLRILSYNLWFREDIAIIARMKAIGKITQSYGLPDILCFQEVTPLIYSILSSQSDWWSNYEVRPVRDDIGNFSYFTAILWRKNRLHPNFAAIPFENSIMGRDLKALVFSICDTKFCVATSHLESPTGKNNLYSASRRAQCAKATEVLDSIASNVVFIGDMNWTEANDGEPPLPQGW